MRIRNLKKLRQHSCLHHMQACGTVMPRATQREPKDTSYYSPKTEVSVCRKTTIAPHQIHYAPLDTKFVAPAHKLPVGDIIDLRPPSDPLNSGAQCDLVSEEAHGSVEIPTQK